MRRIWGVIRDTPIFLGVRKRHLQRRLILREGCFAGAMPAPSTHQSPLKVRHSLPRFFCAWVSVH